MATLQKMVDEIVEYYLANGGADMARSQVMGLAATLSYRDDWPAAYRTAMERIAQFERARQHKTEEREQQQLGRVMMTLIGAAQKSDQPVQSPPASQVQPDLSDSHINYCLERLMDEVTGTGEKLFNQKSHWQAVFRILADTGLYAADDFDYFDKLMARVMPAHVNSPYTRASVKSISQTLFNKPFDKWEYDPELMKKREPYDRMVEVAQCFKSLLEGRHPL